MTTALIIDTEVNSLKARECVELAYCGAELTGGVLTFDFFTVTRFKPTQPFAAGATACHLISPEEVEDCPPSASAILPAAEVLIGYNIDFDMGVLNLSGYQAVCLLAIARALWPEFEQHTLSAVFLELFGQSRAMCDRLRVAHSAGGDVAMTINILQRVLQCVNIQSMADLFAYSEFCRVPKTMPWGKHKGLPIAQVPRDYVAWVLRQEDVDPYLVRALTQ